MNRILSPFNKLIIITTIICVLLMSGCGKTGSGDKNLDTKKFGVDYVIHMSQNLIFMPNYYNEVYGVGDKYEEGIDAWDALNYEEAEKCLLAVEEAINESEKHYSPDDIAFVKESLGLLYCDLARYDKAYDYLIDAYVTMEDLYGDGHQPSSAERLYLQSMRIALCHYYYTTGDYDRCLKELQIMKDENTEEDADSRIAAYQLFIKVTVRDIEAKIFRDRGEYEDAYNLLSENEDACIEYIKSKDDNKSSLGRLLGIDVCTHIADCFSSFTTDSDLAEKVDGYYDNALKLMDGFSDDELKDKRKSQVMMKKGWYLTHFSDKYDEGRELLSEAVNMQEEMYESGKKTPDIVEAYVKYAELYGFVDKDLETALAYYDKALMISKEIYGEKHPQTAMVYESLGRFYGNRMNDDDRAIEYFEEAIGIYRDLLIENNVQVPGMYLQLAGCYKLKGENDLSDEYLNKAYDIWGKLGIRTLQTDGTWK